MSQAIKNSTPQDLIDVLRNPHINKAREWEKELNSIFNYEISLDIIPVQHGHYNIVVSAPTIGHFGYVYDDRSEMFEFIADEIYKRLIHKWRRTNYG